MDLSDALKNAFPEHVFETESPSESSPKFEFYVHTTPILECIYEKRKGKPTTIIKGYQGASADFKKLTSALKKKFNVGGGVHDEQIIIQGDFRADIMGFLKECGFSVKRVGG